MVLFEKIAVVAPQVALIGHIDRPKTVPGNPEEEKPDLCKVV
jgi:hypothetical protein